MGAHRFNLRVWGILQAPQSVSSGPQLNPDIPITLIFSAVYTVYLHHLLSTHVGRPSQSRTRAPTCRAR